LKGLLPATEGAFYEYAKKIKTHPALIIGRLQHNKDIPYSLGQKFFKTIDLANYNSKV
jgi:hypothetical protein